LALLRASERQLRFRLALATLPFVIATTAMLTRHSQWGRLRLIKWEVARPSENMTENQALAKHLPWE
jgi:hypothetical protein